MTFEARLTVLELTVARIERALGMGVNLATVNESQKIIDGVRCWYGVSREDLDRDYRAAPHPECRWLIMYLLRQHCQMSANEIARVLGGRHHTGVLYALRKVGERLKVDRIYFDRVSRIRCAIGVGGGL